MQALVAWTRKALDDGVLHPLLVIAVFVVVFLAIHPFQDGNGQLRVITTLLLLRAGYAYVPYASLESVIEKTRGCLLPGAAPHTGHAACRKRRLAAVA